MRAALNKTLCSPPYLKKVENIDGLSDVRKDELSQQALNVIEAKILPQYGEMIALFEELLTISNHDAGIWRLPNGEEIYRSALRSNNSTTLTADEIHQLGLSEVARIELGDGRYFSRPRII